MKVKVTHHLNLREMAYEEMLNILKHTIFDDDEYEVVGVCNYCTWPSNNDSRNHRVPCSKRDVYIRKAFPSGSFYVSYSTNLSWYGSIVNPLYRSIYVKKLRADNDATASAWIAEPSTEVISMGQRSPYRYVQSPERSEYVSATNSDYYWADTHSYTTYGYRYTYGGVWR